MNELSNSVTAVGTYNNIPTSLTSNTSIVNLIDGLTITKAADKQNWIDGFLTYTITIDNKTNVSYLNPVITDVINDTLIDFVDNSVTINSSPAQSSEYSYDSGTHTLKITLTEVAANTDTTITFRVKKKI